MARYGQAYKDRVVARLLPPESAEVDEVSRAGGLSVRPFPATAVVASAPRDHPGRIKLMEQRTRHLRTSCRCASPEQYLFPLRWP